MADMKHSFSVAPTTADIKRSTFDIPYDHKTTGNFGKLIPFCVMEIMPGDEFDITTRIFSRMSTPLYPVMDDAWIDYYWFFVPCRLVWVHWPEFLGENKYSAWASEVEYIIPHASVISRSGSVYDHMEIPTGYIGSDGSIETDGPELDINILPMRCYALIWNEWYRNQNTTDPLLINTGDDVSSEEVDSYQTLLNAAKPFDQFTAALPSPQKGDAVDIPLLGQAVVKTAKEDVDGLSGYPLRILAQQNSGATNFISLGYNSIQTDQMGTVQVGTGVDTGTSAFGGNNYIVPSNLYADLSGVSAATINQLRMAFQMQRLLELQARSGSRYTEIIRASFGVVSPDARLQRPEYLGGSKVKIQMQQVAQTSATSDESPLGKVGAYSKTVSMNHDFHQAFTEHGYLIGLAVARHKLSYQQGLPRMFSRRGRFDLYWPTFAHIGEQPIYREQIYATGDEANDKAVFGYGEAWIEYRTKPNAVTGAFRSTVDQNLDEWHYADLYTEAPTLSDGWMKATGENVDRTLAVTSAVHDQLIFDFQVDIKATRPMPVYSVPGLIDHF